MSILLRRHDIDPAAVALVPKEPAEILARCFPVKHGEFPRQQVFAYASVSAQPCAMQFVNAMRGIKKHDLAQLPFEAMCVKARVSPVELLGAILMAAKSMKATESALKAILAHPDVVEATVEAAKAGDPILDTKSQPIKDENGKVIRYRGDVAAQRIMHEAVGFLPTKKGGDLNINFGLGRPAEERDGDTDADQDWDDAFPDMGESISSWSADKHRLLTEGT